MLKLMKTYLKVHLVGANIVEVVRPIADSFGLQEIRSNWLYSHSTGTSGSQFIYSGTITQIYGSCRVCVHTLEIVRSLRKCPFMLNNIWFRKSSGIFGQQITNDCGWRKETIYCANQKNKKAARFSDNHAFNNNNKKVLLETAVSANKVRGWKIAENECLPEKRLWIFEEQYWGRRF